MNRIAFLRTGVLGLFLMGAASCGNNAAPDSPEPAPTPPQNPDRGSSGRGGSGGGSGGSTGGTSGGGMAGAAGGGQGMAGQSGSAGAGGATDAGSPDPEMPDPQPQPDAGVSPDSAPPVDPPSPPSAECKVTPGPNAAMGKLAFRPLQIQGVDLGSVGSGKDATGLTEIRFVPGTANEVFVSQKGARINHFRIEGNTATLVRRYNVPGVFAGEDCGLISIAFDPDYQTNKFIYAAYCTGARQSKLARFTVGENLTDAQDILTFSEPQSNNAFHTVGSIGFDNDKNMWMLHGEFFRAPNAQNLGSNLGKLLRFVPNRTAGMGGLTPAEGNPFAGMQGRSPLVYAYGLRSPWRGYHDSKGRYLVGDVGPGTAEELNLVTAPGQNFGWNGSRVGPCNNCGNVVNPISTYRVSNDPYEGQGEERLESRPRRSIWVGAQYQDCGNDRYNGTMTGVYLFGDLFAGWVRGAVIDDTGRKVADRHLASQSALSSFAQGPDGYLYAAKFGSYGTVLTNESRNLFRVELAQ